ncbi:MAG: hypothetical protein H6706_10895 [Myxococcales bacterium]|nr:hypothetical protein [Myxococcales bacterium]
MADVVIDLSPLRPAYRPGDRPRLSATALDAQGRPVPAARLRWTITPTTTATRQGDRLVMVGEGRATLEACAGRVCRRLGVLVLDDRALP